MDRNWTDRKHKVMTKFPGNAVSGSARVFLPSLHSVQRFVQCPRTNKATKQFSTSAGCGWSVIGQNVILSHKLKGGLDGSPNRGQPFVSGRKDAFPPPQKPKIDRGQRQVGFFSSFTVCTLMAGENMAVRLSIRVLVCS